MCHGVSLSCLLSFLLSPLYLHGFQIVEKVRWVGWNFSQLCCPRISKMKGRVKCKRSWCPQPWKVARTKRRDRGPPHFGPHTRPPVDSRRRRERPVRTPFRNLPSLPATSSVLTLHRHPLQEQSPTGQSSVPFLQPRFQLCFSAPRPPSAGHGVNNSHGATPLCLHAENTGKNTTRQGRGA